MKRSSPLRLKTSCFYYLRFQNQTSEKVSAAASTNFWCLKGERAAVQSKLTQLTFQAKPKDKIRA
jgi:hypothetical protein